jgi:hypothetical protein
MRTLVESYKSHSIGVNDTSTGCQDRKEIDWTLHRTWPCNADRHLYLASQLTSRSVIWRVKVYCKRTGADSHNCLSQPLPPLPGESTKYAADLQSGILTPLSRHDREDSLLLQAVLLGPRWLPVYWLNPTAAAAAIYFVSPQAVFRQLHPGDTVQNVLLLVAHCPVAQNYIDAGAPFSQLCSHYLTCA